MNRNLQPLQFNTASLPSSFNIRYRDRITEPQPEGRYGGPGEDTTHSVGTDTPIYTHQKTYDPKQVQAYRKSGSTHSSENNTDKPLLQESGGQLWHYDGLHRLIAARANKSSVDADVSWDKL